MPGREDRCRRRHADRDADRRDARDVAALADELLHHAVRVTGRPGTGVETAYLSHHGRVGFPQQRAPFLIGLALWGAASALVATLFRNFAAYAAALAGYTAAIIASDQLGATGGPNGDAFMLAVTRVSEIGIGIVCAGVVLAATDHGGARRVLARRFAALSAAIAARFTAALVRTGPETPDARKARRDYSA